MDDKPLLRHRDLVQRGINISNTTLLRREAQGAFPKRIYLTPRTVVWARAQIDEFLARLIQKDGEADNG